MSTEYDNLNTLTKDELIAQIKTSMQKQKNLKNLLDNLHGISWEYSLFEDKFTYVSPNAKDILGYEVEEWTDMNSWLSMIHEEDKNEIFNYSTTRTHDGKDHIIEYRMLKSNGEIIWVLDLVNLTKDAEGNITKLCGFIFDITDKKEIQLKQEKEHKFLQTIINGISDPVMIINSDYSVDIMNDKVRKTLEGRTFIDPDSPKCYEISHHQDSPCEGADDPCPLKEVLDTGKDTKVMHNHKHADGSDHFVELAASPLFDDCNNCTGIIESARDVTAYIKLTNELKNQVELTEHRATHDYLTGLPNRALFMDRLAEAIKDTRRHRTTLALFFIDLDHFKEVNDTYGHHMGDEVLKEISKKFKIQIRENDNLSRLSGDEFTIIMKDVKNTEDISVLAKKFINIFEKPIIIVIDV